MGYRGNGFTLIEMMITVAILAFLVAIIAPSFSLQKTSVKTVTQQAELLLSYAREQSLAKQKEITVSINAQLGILKQLSVIDYGVGTGNVLDVYIPDDQVVISFNPTLTEIVFSPTRSIKLKAGTVVSYPTKPINIYFTTTAGSPPTWSCFPTQAER